MQLYEIRVPNICEFDGKTVGFPDLKSLIIIIIIIDWAKAFGSCCWVGSRSGFQGEIPSLGVISEELNAAMLCGHPGTRNSHKSDRRFPVLSVTGCLGYFPTFCLPFLDVWCQRGCCAHGCNSGFKTMQDWPWNMLGEKNQSALVPYCWDNSQNPRLAWDLKTPPQFHLPQGWAEQAQELPKSMESIVFPSGIALQPLLVVLAAAPTRFCFPEHPDYPPELIPGILSSLRKIQVYPLAPLSLFQSALEK